MGVICIYSYIEFAWARRGGFYVLVTQQTTTKAMRLLSIDTSTQKLL